MYFHRLFGFSVLSGFLFATTVFGVLFTTPSNTSSVLGEASRETVTVVPGQQKPDVATRVLTNESASYAMTIPGGWDVDDTRQGAVVFSHPDGMFTVSVITDAVNGTDIPLHSDEMFSFLEKEPASERTVIESGRVNLGALTFNDQPAVRFATYEESLKQYILTTWVRYNGHQYFLQVASDTERHIPALQEYVTTAFSSFRFIDGQAGCPAGHLLFTSQTFTVCYPERLSPMGGIAGEQYVFSSDDERLVIEPAFTSSWPIHVCNFERAVTIGDYQATRTIFRNELSGGCGDIVGFGTTIDTGAASPWYIGLYRENGSYGHEDEFAGIEQTLAITQGSL